MAPSRLPLHRRRGRGRLLLGYLHPRAGPRPRARTWGCGGHLTAAAPYPGRATFDPRRASSGLAEDLELADAELAGAVAGSGRGRPAVPSRWSTWTRPQAADDPPRPQSGACAGPQPGAAVDLRWRAPGCSIAPMETSLGRWLSSADEFRTGWCDRWQACSGHLGKASHQVLLSFFGTRWERFGKWSVVGSRHRQLRWRASRPSRRPGRGSAAVIPGLPLIVVTFWPHPGLRPASRSAAPMLLTGLEERIEHAHRRRTLTGSRWSSFTREFAAWTPKPSSWTTSCCRSIRAQGGGGRRELPVRPSGRRARSRCCANWPPAGSRWTGMHAGEATATRRPAPR